MLSKECAILSILGILIEGIAAEFSTRLIIWSSHLHTRSVRSPSWIILICRSRRVQPSLLYIWQYVVVANLVLSVILICISSMEVVIVYIHV